MTTLAKIFAGSNLLGAVVSLGLFVTTWFSEGIIIAKAREHALESTQTRLKPVIGFLENPKLTEKLPPPIEEKLRGELTDYQSDPEKWLLEIAEGSGERAADFEFPEVRNPLVKKWLAAITQRVSDAPDHFRRSFANLILDLRIFCGTNACAFSLAAWLLFVARTPQTRHWLGLWSMALLIATGTGMYFYINQDWVWSFLFNSYYRWSYPALNAFFAIYLFFRAISIIRPPSDR
jgi:hypothetical protein